MADVNKAWRFPRGRRNEGKKERRMRRSSRRRRRRWWRLRKRETCMHLCHDAERAREKERNELQNFFVELISLMRPDHLTGDFLFFSVLFPSDPRACIHTRAAVARAYVCNGAHNGGTSSRVLSLRRRPAAVLTSFPRLPSLTPRADMRKRAKCSIRATVHRLYTDRRFDRFLFVIIKFKITVESVVITGWRYSFERIGAHVVIPDQVTWRNRKEGEEKGRIVNRYLIEARSARREREDLLRGIQGRKRRLTPCINVTCSGKGRSYSRRGCSPVILDCVHARISISHFCTT